jgi:hypothetical protein
MEFLISIFILYKPISKCIVADGRDLQKKLRPAAQSIKLLYQANEPAGLPTGYFNLLRPSSASFLIQHK